MIIRLVCLLLSASLVFSGCKKVSGEDAAKWLTERESWKLQEVLVNYKPVYRNGEVIEQFGEVTFSRYMERVSFDADGKFRGKFKGDSKEFLFNWVVEAEQVIVSDTVPNSGKWSIPFRTLSEDSFDMETETTALDPPNLTRIRLRFTR